MEPGLGVVVVFVEVAAAAEASWDSSEVRVSESLGQKTRK